MKVVNSNIKINEFSGGTIAVTSIITTKNNSEIIIKSETPKFDHARYAKYEIAENTLCSRRGSFIEAFYSNRQDSFDTILELQRKIISLKLELEVQKRRRWYHFCSSNK